MGTSISTIRPKRRRFSFLLTEGRTLRQQEAVLGWLLLTPVLLIIAVLLIWPFSSAIWISFTDKAVGRDGNWVGVSNYSTLISSPRFRLALQNSLTFTVVGVFFKYLLGMLMALALNQAFRGRNLMRAFFLIPWILPGFVAYMTWRWLYDPLQGMLNHALIDLGIVDYPFAFLSSSDNALWWVTLAHVWRSFPFFGLAFLAGMQNIPQDQYEAAAMDGASVWQRFRDITLPGLRHVSLVVILLGTIWTFNAFEPVYLLTQGGPSDATLVYTMLAFDLGLVRFNLGQASAVSVLMLPLLGLFIVILTTLMNRGDEE